MSVSCPDYDDLKRMSEELGRPVKTLIALVPANDPFFAGLPSSRAAAEWFSDLWHRYAVGHARHIRRVHYILQAQPHGSVLMRDGSPYENTDACWYPMAAASKYARYLGLLDQRDLVDRRNPDPLLFYRPVHISRGDLWVGGGGGLWEMQSIDKPEFPALPSLHFSMPSRKRPVMVEIWVEKAGDIDDVLVPICERRGVNLIPCKGEQGNDACCKVVERTLEARCPARILYLSDFDPAGDSMPVSVARKIEFEVRKRDLELDIQVRPIGLTHEQCVRYKLPRTPIKESERRSARFEERFGEGATELDALEALHPGELRKIVEAEIARYQDVDPDVDRRFSAISHEVWAALGITENSVLARHAASIEALRQEHDRILADFDRIENELSELAQQVSAVFDEVSADLEDEKPDLSQWDWPAPSEPRDDPDPLFDSRRTYLEQIDRYKLHQGKPIQARRKGRPPTGGRP